MIIQHNIPGINATRNKGISEGRLKKNLEKLSSGYRINRAGDDAAGLTLSELMRGQISGLNQAMRNVNDGISMTQTGDGVLTEVHAMLGRMKTLAVQSANGTYTTAARENLDAERLQLLDEINRIADSSHFNGIPFFARGAVQEPLPNMADGDEANIQLQVGYSAPETMDVHRYKLGDSELMLKDTKFTTIEDANASIDQIEKAIEAVSDIRADFGAAYNHLEHTHNNLSVTTENMTAAESQIRDTKMADEITQFTKNNIFYQSANSMAAQANAVVQNVLSLIQ
ncbi:MAG: flagellin [Lachnospiraceae bacterium]